MEQVDDGSLNFGACLMAEDESVVTDTLADMVALARSPDIWSPIATRYLSTEGMPRRHRKKQGDAGQRAALVDQQLASKAALTCVSKDAIALYEAGTTLLGYFRPMNSLPAWYSTKVQPMLRAIAGALGGWQFRLSLHIDDMAPANMKIVHASALIDVDECIRAMKILAALGRPSVHLPARLQGVRDISLDEVKDKARMVKYRLNEKNSAVRIQNRQLEEADEFAIRTYFGHFPALNAHAISVLSHVWKASITDFIVDVGTVIHTVYFQHGLPDLAAEFTQAFLRLAAAYEDSSYLRDYVATSPRQSATMLRTYLQFMAEHWDLGPTDPAVSAEHALTAQALLNFVEPSSVPPRLTGTPASYHFLHTLSNIEKNRECLLALITLDLPNPATSTAPYVTYLIAKANHLAERYLQRA